MGFFNNKNIWGSGSQSGDSSTVEPLITDGITPPVGIDRIWFDRSSRSLKTYNSSTGNWEPIASAETTVDPEGDQGGAAVPQLAEVNQSIVVGGYGTTRVSIPIGFDKYDLRIVEATNTMNQNLSLAIYENAIDGKKIYQSLSQMSVYDICNIPCEDKDGTKMVHVEVKNHGVSEAEIIITVKATSLQ
ncbi:hypothetical protein ACP8H2_09260 [Bacillus subtilis]|uniref:hypothetical protein n=1 Tax=Bacillus subtilis TaxID=1423 RepID=UPI002DBF5E5D|nr:hypothetical protein [Bacillus subtilis]MEC2335128.1 hypothetical protein [Bacillus subtilis]